jgi:uncharacterized protein
MAKTATLGSPHDDAASPETAHDTFRWNELMTRDVERAKCFYAETIGWTFAPNPMPDGRTYWVASEAGKPVGIFPIDAPEFDGVPESWMSYLAVDDVGARVEKALPAGAAPNEANLRRALRRAHRHPHAAWRRRQKPIFDVPCVGRIAILMQPGGAGIGWMTPTPAVT